MRYIWPLVFPMLLLTSEAVAVPHVGCAANAPLYVKDMTVIFGPAGIPVCVTDDGQTGTRTMGLTVGTESATAEGNAGDLIYLNPVTPIAENTPTSVILTMCSLSPAVCKGVTVNAIFRDEPFSLPQQPSVIP